MNGNSGIVPTVDLATNNNNGYAYPIMPMMGGYGYGNGFSGDGLWILILFALLFGNGNWGNNGGFFGGNSFDNGFAWLSNGQKEIMNNTNNGFDTLHLSNQIESVQSGINGLSNAICSSTASINSNVSNGFYNAEVAACNRQIADMNQNFNNQLSTLQSFNGLERQLCDCCCENRLGIQDLKATVISENCTDREVLREIGQNILVNQTANTQKIIDEIFRDRLDEKDSKIDELNRQLLMKDLQASQTAQNAFIANGLNNEVDALYNRLATCPINTIPVYGNQRIFACPNNNGCGCGCNNYNNVF